jgi:hypothetical protein
MTPMRRNFVDTGMESAALPILRALVQIVQALLGPGAFRITPPKWLPHVPAFPAFGP